MSDGDGVQRPRGSLLWLAYLSGAFGLAAFSQMAFLVPLRARELGATFDVIGLLVGAASFASAFASVTSGAVIDRLGPRNAFLLGTGASALIGSTFVLVTGYWWFLPLQALMGLAINLAWVASQAYVTSIGSATERALHTGRFTFFTNVGQMTGPLLVGGAAQLIGFRWALAVPAAYGLLFAGLALFLAETRDVASGPAETGQGLGFRSALGLLRIRGMQVALLLSFTRLWIWFTFSTFLPVLLVDAGVAAGVAGTVIAAAGLVAAILSPSAGFWARRLSEPVVLMLALACGATGLLLAPHLQTIPIVYVVPFLVGIGSGLSLPLLLAIVTAAAPDGQRGVALGLRGMVNQVASTAAPVLVGPLIAALGLSLGFTTGGLVGLGMITGARLLHRGTRGASADRRRHAAPSAEQAPPP